MFDNCRIDYDDFDKNVKLDLKDKKILLLLSENSRIPLTQIAKKVMLSRDAVDYRIKRLQEKGIILAFVPNFNYAKLGFQTFHIFLLLDELDEYKQKELIKNLKIHANVLSVIEYNDRWDLEIVLLAEDIIEFDKIISDISEISPDIILEKDKLEVIRRYNYDYVPPIIKEEHEMEVINLQKQLPVKLDEIDYKLLRILSENCRASTYALGLKLEISSDAVGYRIKKLLKEGVIRFFSVLVNFSLLKYHWYTFSIEMKLFNLKNEKKFEAFLNQNKNILRSAKTLGPWDLFLYVVVENPKEFHQIVKLMKREFSDIIRSYDAWIAYKEHCFNPMPKIIKKKS